MRRQRLPRRFREEQRHPQFLELSEGQPQNATVIVQNRRLHTDLWLPHRRLYVRTEMMIEAPAQYLIAEGGYLWIQMRIDDLRQDGLMFEISKGYVTMLPSALRNHAEGSSRFSISTRRFVSNGQMYSSLTRGSSVNMVPNACSLGDGRPTCNSYANSAPSKPSTTRLGGFLR